MKYKPYGERSILIEWPQKIDKTTLNDVLNFKKALQNKYAKQKVYINSAYCSILISYDTTINNIYDRISDIKRQYSKEFGHDKSTYNLWRIPVCYDDYFALDLDELSEVKKCDKSEIIRRHCEAVYTVYFIGFLPGFLYLGGLHKYLHMPRKAKPRLNLLGGAVGIGGQQTGIYPHDGPGGWNIIGNSPVDLFKADQDKPCFAKAGDRVQFYKVTLEEHQKIKALEATGFYKLESEVIDD
ncbi:MAG: 5-oxoprolinase subunit PxpB [Bacteroidia bacterium]|nr:5-oxoprolinase subunit PxpB [Bacteroidia bacterium]